MLGILNGLGAVLGIVGTLVFPVLVKRIGLVRTGVIGFWSEFSVLIFCLCSLFVPGTLFSPAQKLISNFCSTNSFARNANGTTSNNIIEWIISPCVYGKSSVLLLVLGVTLNRFGTIKSTILLNRRKNLFDLRFVDC